MKTVFGMITDTESGLSRELFCNAKSYGTPATAAVSGWPHSWETPSRMPWRGSRNRMPRTTAGTLWMTWAPGICWLTGRNPLHGTARMQTHGSCIAAASGRRTPEESPSRQRPRFCQPQLPAMLHRSQMTRGGRHGSALRDGGAATTPGGPISETRRLCGPYSAVNLTGTPGCST